MAFKLYRRFLQGIGITPKASSENAVLGDLEVLTTTNKLYFHNDSGNDPVVTETVAATLTNKTIDADDNTILDLDNTNLNGAAGITNANLATMPDQRIKGNVSGGAAVPSDLTAAQVNTMLGTSGSATSIGALDSQAANADGLALVSQVLSSQSADATHPGMVNNVAQTLSGQKTFSTGITVSNLDFTQAVDSTTTGANQNVAAPTVGTIIFTNASLSSIQNIGAGAAGRVLVIKNSTGVNVTINNDSGGTAADRIVTGNGANIILPTTASLLLQYDSSASRWTVIGGSGSSTTYSIRNDFTGTGAQTAFTLSASPTSIENTWVYIDGVYQNKASYSVSGTTLTFSAAPALNDSIEVITGINTINTVTGSINVNSYTGDGTTTGFTLSTDPNNINNTWVFLGGVYQNKSTYSVSGTTLTFSTAPPNTVPIQVLVGSVLDIGVPAANSVNTASIQNAAVTDAKTNFTYPTITRLSAAGSGTYNVPAGVKHIRLKMVGGGGGGGGGGNSGGVGGTGGTTDFGGMTCLGGTGGQGGVSAGSGGAGGAGGATGGTTFGDAVVSVRGGSGTGGSAQFSSLATSPAGGAGGSSPFGGNGGGSAGGQNSATAGIDNTGSGGGGGSGNGAGSQNVSAGGGGGAGGYRERFITPLLSSYSYTVGGGGVGGTAGTAGVAGAAGGAGVIIIEEFYV